MVFRRKLPASFTLNMNIKINDKNVKTFKIPVREPVIKASLRIEDHPRSLPPGLTGDVDIVVRDEGSELPAIRYLLCREENETSCIPLVVRSGGRVAKKIRYGPGTHKPVLKFGDKIVTRAEFTIAEEPLEVNTRLLGEPSLTYPDGGTLSIRVSEAKKAPIRIRNVILDAQDASVLEVLTTGSPLVKQVREEAKREPATPETLESAVRKAALEASMLFEEISGKTEELGIEEVQRASDYIVTIPVTSIKSPLTEIELTVKINVEDAMGRDFWIEMPLKVSIQPSEKWLEETRSRIESLVAEARSLASAGRLAQALLKAVEAATTCSSATPFIDCSDVEPLPEQLLSNAPLGTVYPALKNAVESLEEESAKQKLMPLLEKYEEMLQEIKARVEELLEKYREAYKKGKLGEASEAIESAMRICEGLGVEVSSVTSLIPECSEVVEAHQRIEKLRSFLLKDVSVTMPARTRLGWFRVGVSARNRLSEELTGVYIDFGPAKDYLELPEEKIKLPPLYPGMEIAREVRVKSLFTGTIVIPYKVCLGDLCVDKKGKVVVGSTAASEAALSVSGGSLGADVLVGKSVLGLEKLGLGPKHVQALPREIVIGEYKCTCLLGMGGFSITLLCSRMGVNTVLKIPPEAYWVLLSGGSPTTETLHLSDDLLKAFDREARVLKELRHPNIVKLVEYGLNPFPYLAFEYCELGELKRALSVAGKLKPKTALEVMIPITAAVAHAHAREKPIIHMDIKPENILLTRDYVPKLTDFNISRIIGTVSRTSAAKGYTQGYAAPEQLGIEGYPPPNTYTDVFALGVVLYELITGVRPYPVEVYQNNFKTPYKPKPASELNPETPRDLDDILELALQPNPDDRIYKDATQLLKDLWDTYQQHYYG